MVLKAYMQRFLVILAKLMWIWRLIISACNCAVHKRCHDKILAVCTGTAKNSRETKVVGSIPPHSIHRVMPAMFWLSLVCILLGLSLRPLPFVVPTVGLAHLSWEELLRLSLSQFLKLLRSVLFSGDLTSSVCECHCASESSSRMKVCTLNQ